MLTTTDSGEAEVRPTLQEIHRIVHHPEHGLTTITTTIPGAIQPEATITVDVLIVPILRQEAIHRLMVAAEVLAPEVHHQVDHAEEPETDL